MTERATLLSRRMVVRGSILAAVAAGAALSATPLYAQDDQKFPAITDVAVSHRGGTTYDFDVTVSSPYDTPQRYADAFRVLSPDGQVLGERILLHDHQNEQPFTRDVHGVKIPSGMTRVTVQGRDQKFGWGGITFAVTLPGR